MLKAILARMGADLDERISNLLSLILCATLPILFAVASSNLPVPQ